MNNTIKPLVLSRAEVREVDRRAIEEFGIPGVVLMENAGRGAAEIILSILQSTSHRPENAQVAIVCGSGNNGGDGFVVARHLSNAGVRVALFLAGDPSRLTGDAATNYEIVRRMHLPIRMLNTPEQIEAGGALLASAVVVVDALLGTGFSGDVRPPQERVIDAINAARRSAIVAIDVPSGLDCDTGRSSNATVRANATITFVAIKKGFDSPGAADFTGKVHVVDIGAPAQLIQAVASETGSG